MNENKREIFLSSFGLIKTSCDLVADKFLEWQQEVLKEWGFELTSQKYSGSLELALSELMPLSSTKPKYLVWPIDGSWTLFFDNGIVGTDPGPLYIISERLSVDAIRVVMSDHLIDTQSKQVAQYGATIFEYYSNGDEVRAVYSANDGGKWRFGQSGKPFSFENLELFKTGPVKDRFTHLMLIQYLKALGLDTEKIKPTSTGTGYIFTKVACR